MLDILFTEDCEYFKKKLIDVGNSRIGSNLTNKSRYGGQNKSSYSEDQVVEIGDNLFMVESEANSDNFYKVDMR